MFISTTQLSKLMKEAYKGSGIQVGNIDEGLIILGEHWGLWIDENYIPNKVKAIVMELAGVLPAQGRILKVSKENPEPQYELILDNYFYLNELEKSSKEPASKTRVMLDLKYAEYELLQIDRMKRIALINRKLMSLIDTSELDLNIEGEPSGPCTGVTSNVYFWRNTACTLMLFGTEPPKDNAVLAALSKVDFEKEARR